MKHISEARKKTKGNQGRSLKTKAAVLGAIQRKGNIIAKVVSDTTISTIKPFSHKHVHLEASLKTDEYRAYKTLKKLGTKTMKL